MYVSILPSADSHYLVLILKQVSQKPKEEEDGMNKQIKTKDKGLVCKPCTVLCVCVYVCVPFGTFSCSLTQYLINCHVLLSV